MKKSAWKSQKIMIPLLSKQENNEIFLSEAIGDANEIILLMVIDTHEMQEKFGFATTEIMQGNELVEQIKKTLTEKGVSCEDLVEWGETSQKIVNTAKLKKVDKVVLKKQENQLFEDLVKKLHKEKIETEII